jgi:hypothetical protein
METYDGDGYLERRAAERQQMMDSGPAVSCKPPCMLWQAMCCTFKSQQQAQLAYNFDSAVVRVQGLRATLASDTDSVMEQMLAAGRLATEQQVSMMQDGSVGCLKEQFKTGCMVLDITSAAAHAIAWLLVFSNSCPAA